MKGTLLLIQIFVYQLILELQGTNLTYNLSQNQPMPDTKVYNHNMQHNVMKI